MDEREVTVAFRVGHLMRCRGLLVRERGGSGRGAHAIDQPLGEHRAKPCREAASAVEIAEEGSPFASGPAETGHYFGLVGLGRLTLEAEEVGVQRIRELTGAAAWIQRVGSAIQHGPVFQDEMVPRGFVPGRACACEGEILVGAAIRCSAATSRAEGVGRRMPCVTLASSARAKSSIDSCHRPASARR